MTDCGVLTIGSAEEKLVCEPLPHLAEAETVGSRRASGLKQFAVDDVTDTL